MNWHMTEQIDRIRMVHALKVVTSTSNPGNKKKTNELTGVPCKYFQNGKCSQKVTTIWVVSCTNTCVVIVTHWAKNLVTQQKIVEQRRQSQT